MHAFDRCHQLLATAFGVRSENTVFVADSEVRISLNYITGNLVKFGQPLAGVMMGRGRRTWLPFLALWSAMLGGAVAGASLWPVPGLAGLWVAVGTAPLLSFASAVIERRNYPQI